MLRQRLASQSEEDWNMEEGSIRRLVENLPFSLTT
jgi:hypothetical protein